MVTQLAKGNFERAETGGGAHIKPVVMLLNGQVELGAAEEKPLVRILLYELKTTVAELVVPVAKPAHRRYRIRTVCYRFEIAEKHIALIQTHVQQFLHPIIFPLQRRLDAIDRKSTRMNSSN